MKKINKSIALVLSSMVIMSGMTYPAFADENDASIDTSDTSEMGETDEIETADDTDSLDAQEERQSDPEELGYVPGEIIVVYDRTDDGETLSALSDELDGNVETELDATDDYEISLVNISDDTTVEQAIAEYEADENVISAEPNMVLETQEDIITSPNDTYFSKQYYLLEDNGSTSRGTNTQAAWSVLNKTELSDVTVAVLDTGASKTNPDLKDVVDWDKSAEIKLDSNNNFIATELKGDGYDNDEQSTAANYHGTHVTGIIAAEANNSAGVAEEAAVLKDKLDIFVVDICNNGRSSTTSYMIVGLTYAVNNGAKVVNTSIGGATTSTEINENSALARACKAAEEGGVIIVCAGGNYNNDKAVIPADYSSTISVVNTGKNGIRYSTASYGQYKDISAPGETVFSTYADTYGSKTGSSMSAPEVTGIVALMCSVDPDITPAQAKSILCETATDLDAEGFDVNTGYGLVNAEKALRALVPEKSVLSITSQPVSVSAGLNVNVKFSVEAKSSANEAISYQWYYRSAGTNTCTWKKTSVKGYRTSTIIMAATEARDGNSYRCNITDESGNMLISDAVTLTLVKESITIKTQTQSVTAKNGATVSISVGAESSTGETLSYQWYYKTSGSKTWKKTSVKGYRTSTITMAATGARNGNSYRCIITDSSGNSMTSDAATLTVQ